MRFELLYAKHAPAVKAYALRRADASMADDVVAEVFVVCWRRFDELPVDPLPWLLGVARRVLSTQRRGERRRAALRVRLAETNMAPAADTASSAEMTSDRLTVAPRVGDEALANGLDAALAGALARLSDGDRELLLLIAWDGLSPAEAAGVLQIKPATARVRLLRARRRLTQALAQDRSDPTTCPSLSMETPS
ncbi:MAG TPA: sigma-70 family RNA polymerase sigma factor [Solirubrobacteraceae bacterium]|nr:sigma-70 family RNA polymerase sigma factor [Solirubrobacteraceae bacterium]